MERASGTPKTVIVSEWTSTTANEYMQIQSDSHLQVLYVSAISVSAVSLSQGDIGLGLIYRI